MQWFLVALIGPALYALANHTDKYLISKYFKGGNVGALIIFSGLASFLVLPIIYFIDNSVFSVNPLSASLLLINGTLTVFSVLFYLYALVDDDASVVIPFYQTIPIFGFVLGYFVLGETLNFYQALGTIVIIVGATILSFKEEDGAFKFRKKVVLLMIAASILYAINGVIFKYLAIDVGFWMPAFWTFLGKALIGVFFLVLVPVYRRQFVEVFKINSKPVLSINTGNEIVTIIADGVFYFASLMAPVVLVLTVNGFQPFFVLLYGLILAKFVPSIATEFVGRRDLNQRVFAMILIFVGTIFITF